MSHQAKGAADVDAYPRRWPAAVVMIVAVTMDLIDLTIVNVALPTIRTDLHASPSQLEWVISAYMLSFAALLIVAGSFGDLLGRRRVFLAGIVVFGGASLAAGLAQSPGELIAARVVQGAAAAAMIPQLLATFRVIFAGPERGKAFGMYGAILGIAAALGLVLGGLLTSADVFGWSWRTVFLINVPIALLSFVAAIRFVPETYNPEAGRPGRRRRSAARRLDRRDRLPLLGTKPRLASLDLAAAHGGPRRAGRSRAPGASPEPAGRAASAPTPPAQAGLLGRAARAARLLGWPAGLLPRLRDLDPAWDGLHAARRRADGARLQHRQL